MSCFSLLPEGSTDTVGGTHEEHCWKALAPSHQGSRLSSTGHTMSAVAATVLVLSLDWLQEAGSGTQLLFVLLHLLGIR